VTGSPLKSNHFLPVTHVPFFQKISTNLIDNFFSILPTDRPTKAKT